ncbi:MAG: Branched-chain-amino-acid aminotransferase 2 [Promethearchaeota archaeon]|nr:MAG: Branched-chain-amino-acid aminotransferase 2 [Candidatus Lokiarchaeota archaeon]
MQATKKPQIDFDNLKFDFYQTEWMFLSNFRDGKWDEGELVPFNSIELSPAACILNYGQGIFEGMKALQAKDGRITLFRPMKNAERFEKSAIRLVMPPYDKQRFVKEVKEVTLANNEFVPPYESGGSLYLRPLLIGSGPVLGIAPAKEYTFIVFCSPVGPYFPKGFKTISLLISDKYTRASPGGTGSTKTCSNYSRTMRPALEGKMQGYDQIIYLDAIYKKYITEVGAANFCAIIDGNLVTPRFDGTILEGITLDSVLTLAKHNLGIEIEQRDLSYEELFTDECTELFCTGTAAVITPIGTVSYETKKKIYNNNTPGPITKKLYDLLTGIQKLDLPDDFGWTTIL